MKRHSEIRWMIALAGILVVASAVAWADEKPLPTGPSQPYRPSPVSLSRNTYEIEEGPITAPPGGNDSGWQNKGGGFDLFSAGAASGPGRSGGGLTSGGSLGPSKTEVVEKNLRRTAKQLR